METFWITAAAVLWGAGPGLLTPRAAYRLSVQPEEPWRAACPAGHPSAGAGNGWLGRARCADCASYGPSTPVLAVGTAAVCAVLAAGTGARPELMVWLLTAPVGVLLAIVDVTVERLPDVVTLPLVVITMSLRHRRGFSAPRGGHPGLLWGESNAFGSTYTAPPHSESASMRSYTAHGHVSPIWGVSGGVGF